MDPTRLAHLPSVKVAMTPFPHAVERDAPLDRARAMLDAHGVHQLPVVADGRLVGVLFQRDLERGGAGAGARVADLCVPDPYVVDDGERLDGVLERMAREHLAVALVTRRDKLVGIFTVTDACRLFAEWLRARFPDGGDDQAA